MISACIVSTFGVFVVHFHATPPETESALRSRARGLGAVVPWHRHCKPSPVHSTRPARSGDKDGNAYVSLTTTIIARYERACRRRHRAVGVWGAGRRYDQGRHSAFAFRHDGD